ncbi:MAG: dienelactone hydrolase family protein [Patescibacteria group bacterium]|nr:dienelactone hydrolase family protein [Patescibacteria group bacterium]
MKKEIEIIVNAVVLRGILALPKGTKSLVIFAHGAGSSRLSPRNNYVASVLQKRGIGTLLFDLLTEEEDVIFENRFDIDLITDRLIKTTDWFFKNPETKGLSCGYFGASTGAAAALEAAAYFGERIKAIVSRGGRPDLANIAKFPKIKAPTLLVVGAEDFVVIELNKETARYLLIPKKIEIIPYATHLFEEPGALEKVAELAADWFKKYLG